MGGTPSISTFYQGRNALLAKEEVNARVGMQDIALGIEKTEPPGRRFDAPTATERKEAA